MINNEGTLGLKSLHKGTIINRSLSTETTELYFFRNEIIINYLVHSDTKDKNKIKFRLQTQLFFLVMLFKSVHQK